MNANETLRATVLEKSVYKIGLSSRATNVLGTASINTVAELTQKTIQELGKYRNCGQFCIMDYRRQLARIGGLTLKGAPIWTGESVHDLGLQLGALGALKKVGIQSVTDLCSHSETALLAKIKFPLTVAKIVRRLKVLGHSLKQD